jgi:hypothetical protein
MLFLKEEACENTSPGNKGGTLKNNDNVCPGSSQPGFVLREPGVLFPELFFILLLWLPGLNKVQLVFIFSKLITGISALHNSLERKPVQTGMGLQKQGFFK